MFSYLKLVVIYCMISLSKSYILKFYLGYCAVCIPTTGPSKNKKYKVYTNNYNIPIYTLIHLHAINLKLKCPYYIIYTRAVIIIIISKQPGGRIQKHKRNINKSPWHSSISCKPEAIQHPSEAKSKPNAWYTHAFSKK